MEKHETQNDIVIAVTDMMRERVELPEGNVEGFVPLSVVERWLLELEMTITDPGEALTPGEIGELAAQAEVVPDGGALPFKGEIVALPDGRQATIIERLSHTHVKISTEAGQYDEQVDRPDKWLGETLNVRLDVLSPVL